MSPEFLSVPRDSTSHYIDRYREEFTSLLDDPNVTEEGLHQFLVSTPVLLPLWWPFLNKVFTKLRLGSQHVTDFAFARKTTLGLQWYFIELEHPKTPLFKKNGDPSAELVHGMRQLRDWETWFKENRHYVENNLPLSRSAKVLGLCDPELILVIGRRQTVSDAERPRLRALSRDNLEIMTFDRLLSESGSGCFPQFTVDTCTFGNAGTKVVGSVALTESAMMVTEDDYLADCHP